MILKKKIQRRMFLRGAGAAIALPFLDAMIPALALPAEKASPLRMAFCYVPNGIIMENWLPQIPEGNDVRLPLKFPRISKALEPYRDDLLMFGGMTCNGARSLGDGPGDHGRAGANYLTAVHPKKTSGKDISAGISVDQLVAARIGGETPFASLELGCEEGLQGGNCDSGYSCAYSNSISWRTPSSPLAPEVRPRAVFERLFGGGYEPDPVKHAQKAEMRGSILDLVMGRAASLKTTLGAADQRKLDEYLFSVRDLEKRIQKAEQAGGVQPVTGVAQPPSSIPNTFEAHSQLMFDMMTIAFQTNATRIITMLMGVEYSSRPYHEIGVTEGHHGLTHHMGDADKIEKVTKINELHAKQFAYFLHKLKTTQDGEGTLLDHSMVIYGSALADGSRHQHDHVPTVLAGHGNGTLRPGRFLTYSEETPLANLWLSMASRMGIGEKVGDSTGQLANLG